MERYKILSEISADALQDPFDFEKMAATAKKKIKEEYPDVARVDSYGVKGAYDVVDILESSDPTQTDKTAMIIR